MTEEELLEIEARGLRVGYTSMQSAGEEFPKVIRDVRALVAEVRQLQTRAAETETLHTDVADRLEKCAFTVATTFPGVRMKLLRLARRLRGLPPV